MAGGWALLVLGVAGLALALSGMGSATAKPLRAKATGALRIADSNGERAVLTASNMAPGGTIRGSVAIRDAGASPAALTLAMLNLRDDTGGPLSGALHLTVRDVTGNSVAVVYAGPFSGLGRLRVGALGPGRARRYSFEATLPGSTDTVTDPALAGASTSADYRWKLERGVLARCAATLRGSAGPDRIVGTVGGDRIVGGRGRDRLLGGARPDCIEGGPGRDRLFGNRGDDLIRARDGAPDLVDCGPGAHDVAFVDRHDVTRRCETVRRSGPAR